MQLPKFAVGDTVRIREWDDMAAEYKIDSDGDIRGPGCYFVRSMRYLCGNIYKIASIESLYDVSFQYHLVEMEDRNEDWTIAEFMLEPALSNPVDTTGLIADLCSMFE